MDPFDKSDDSHNTWISVGPITVWGGKIDWLLYSDQSLTCMTKHISEGNISSDHPYLRLDLFRRIVCVDADWEEGPTHGGA